MSEDEVSGWTAAWCAGWPRLVGAGHVARRVPTRDPGPEWRRAWAERRADLLSPEGLPGFAIRLSSAEERTLVARAKAEMERELLRFGGWAVCQPALDSDLDRILSRGFVTPAEGARVRLGEPSRCHQNSASLWWKSPKRRAVVTGYALSDDGMWRSHSWVLERPSAAGTPALVETTVPRVAYAGFVRTPLEARELLAWDHPAQIWEPALASDAAEGARWRRVVAGLREVLGALDPAAPPSAPGASGAAP